MSSHGFDKKEGTVTDGGGIISYDELPLDLTVDIFWRLPAKYVVRLGCVSKLWSSIINAPNFLNHPSNRPQFLVCVKKKNYKLFITTLSQHQNPPTKSFGSYCMTVPADFYICSESVRGLLCFKLNGRRTGVWNPSMRQCKVLPQSKIRFWPISLLGYEPIEDKYKVLCISTCRVPNLEKEVAEVLTLGTEEPWRVAKGCPFHGFVVSGPCINGVIYYEAIISHEDDHKGDYDKDVIMRFDVRSEKFKVMDIPQHDKDPGYSHLFNYEGKLAWVCCSFSSMNLWFLEDYEKQEWSCRNLILPFSSSIDLIWRSDFHFRGIVDATSELIFIAKTNCKSSYAFCIWFYDPKRNNVREFKFEGTAYEEFTRGSDEVTGIRFFPNHIENFMSSLILGVPHIVDLLLHARELHRSLKIVA